jgi:hypothetical protein
MSTLYLDVGSWDLTLDANRNIALAVAPYERAQTVANACRLWKGEAPFDIERGIPYETEILGKQPPPRVLYSLFEAEARTVPGIVSASAVLQYADRGLTGQIQCTLDDGTVINV